MEEAVGAGRDGLVAIHAARADDADGGLGVLHDAALHRRGVGAQEHVGVALYEECVLHVARGMVFSKVERREHVPVILDFRALGYGEAETREYGDDFVLDKRQRMTRTQRHRYGRAAQVEIVIDSVSVFESLAQSGQTVGGHGLELVELLSELALLLGGHIAEILHESCDGPFCSDI